MIRFTPGGSFLAVCVLMVSRHRLRLLDLTMEEGSFSEGICICVPRAFDQIRVHTGL